MSESVEKLSARIEKKVLRKVILLFSVAAIIAVAVGIGIGVLISERRAIAGNNPVSGAPEAMSVSFAEVAKQVEPAVVNIDTKGKIPDISTKEEKPTNGTPDEILDYFRRQLPRRPSYAVGSGFIVDKAGYILTNYHVIEDSSRITVKLQGGEEYVAKIIGTDEPTDLAVLKIEAGKDLPSVKLGDSNTTQVGDWVLAVGSPFGLAQTVTAGIISQTKRETPFATPFQKFVQTDAAINRGNSGGPLVNMNGEVIGVNSQIATTTGDYNGIGFALPSNEAAYVYQQILQNGKVRRGYLGVGLDSVKPEFAKVYNLPEAKGAIITDLIDKTSPAGLAGLQVGDIITEINGEKIENAQDLISKVSLLVPEKEITLTYLRENGEKIESHTIKIKLNERPPSGNSSDDSTDSGKKLGTGQNNAAMQPLGLTITDLTPALATPLKLENQKGALVKAIDPASFIADLKDNNGRDLINEGDLIQRVNRISVTDAKSFNDIVSKLKTGDAVVMQVARFSRRSNLLQQRIVQFTVQ